MVAHKLIIFLATLGGITSFAGLMGVYAMLKSFISNDFQIDEAYMGNIYHS